MIDYLIYDKKVGLKMSCILKVTKFLIVRDFLEFSWFFLDLFKF